MKMRLALLLLPALAALAVVAPAVMLLSNSRAQARLISEQNELLGVKEKLIAALQRELDAKNKQIAAQDNLIAFLKPRNPL
jgi:ABC-type transport system involved in cytochrome bd biosynthesis fused ATPase/permease subunit